MELRHARRVSIECPIAFTGPHLTGKGVVLNLSTSGCLVASPQKVEQGTELQVRLFLPDGGAPLDIPAATVQWLAGDTFGLKPISLTDEDWKRLRQLVVRYTDQRVSSANAA